MKVVPFSETGAGNRKSERRKFSDDDREGAGARPVGRLFFSGAGFFATAEREFNDFIHMLHRKERKFSAHFLRDLNQILFIVMWDDDSFDSCP